MASTTQNSSELSPMYKRAQALNLTPVHNFIQGMECRIIKAVQFDTIENRNSLLIMMLQQYYNEALYQYVLDRQKCQKDKTVTFEA